jgi:hypothetical protein
MMHEAAYYETAESAERAVGRFLNEKYPSLDPSEHEAFVRLVSVFDAGSAQQAVVKPGDIVLIKLLCETLFRDNIIPNAAGRLKRPQPNIRRSGA